jgi:lipid A disaccharide synthetase
MILPLNKPELIIFHGLLGLIFKIPKIGLFLKKNFIKFLSKNPPLLALPNKISKKEIIPEMVQLMTPQDLATQVLSLYENEEALHTIRKNLKIFSESTHNHKNEPMLVDQIINTMMVNQSNIKNI